MINHVTRGGIWTHAAGGHRMVQGHARFTRISQQLIIAGIFDTGLDFAIDMLGDGGAGHDVARNAQPCDMNLLVDFGVQIIGHNLGGRHRIR